MLACLSTERNRRLRDGDDCERAPAETLPGHVLLTFSHVRILLNLDQFNIKHELPATINCKPSVHPAMTWPWLTLTV